MRSGCKEEHLYNPQTIHLLQRVHTEREITICLKSIQNW